MSKRILKKYVHVLRDVELVTFAPGDELPDWAADIVTNPDVFATILPTAPAEPTPAPPAPAETPADDLDALKADELKAIAVDLGIAPKGNKDTLKAAIRAARTTVEEPDADHSHLIEKAKELGYEDAETLTEEELEAIVEE
ncbi:hypothetical protein [Microbacterium sp. No. 7]|uniref:hypothetical protein n=1 Tax=Microbacterium sp. No. 7 TaxID=1714373 RepID=UPI0006D0F14E|nr:hypothetical protein [Microbacterium sp. No. 7]